MLIDSITELLPQHAGAAVFTGSHGGNSAAQNAPMVNTAVVVFNDAGVGKAQAGIASLGMLQAADRAAATVSHVCACIGQANDTFENGVFSHANDLAFALGIATGQRCKDWFATHLKH